MSEELKPCPLCASDARIAKRSRVVGTASKYRFYREKVVCKNKRCLCSTQEFKRPGLAAKAWNTRPSVSPSPDVMALKDLYTTLVNTRAALSYAKHFIPVSDPLFNKCKNTEKEAMRASNALHAQLKEQPNE